MGKHPRDKASGRGALLKLEAIQDRYSLRGRPPEFPLAFADRRLWRDLTYALPTVTHETYADTDTRSGPFVDFVEAARATVGSASYDGNFSVAAEKAAALANRLHKRQR